MIIYNYLWTQYFIIEEKHLFEYWFYKYFTIVVKEFVDFMKKYLGWSEDIQLIKFW